MVGSLVKCRSALFNPGGGYKKRVLWEVSGVQIQAVPQCLYTGGTIVLTMTSGFHEVVEARQSRGLECAVWRRACGKANVEMNSRLGDGQPPGLKSADRAKRGIFLTASR